MVCRLGIWFVVEFSKWKGVDLLFLLGKGRQRKADCQAYKGQLLGGFHCLLSGFRMGLPPYRHAAGLCFVIVGRIASGVVIYIHRYNSKHYIPVLFDDLHPNADFGAVPDPSSLPATVCWSLVGFAGGMRAELERLSGRSPLWGLNAPEVLVEREEIYQDP